MTGVGVAYEFLLSLRRVSCLNTSRSQRISPLFASTQITCAERPSSVADVTNTRSSQTTGDDQPCPGIGVFHATFFSSDHSVGTFGSEEMPCPVGPRNRGQFSAFAAVAKIRGR